MRDYAAQPRNAAIPIFNSFFDGLLHNRESALTTRSLRQHAPVAPVAPAVTVAHGSRHWMTSGGAAGRYHSCDGRRGETDGSYLVSATGASISWLLPGPTAL